MSPFADRPSAGSPPSVEDRRRAACLAMSKATGLIRFAARYTRHLPDAEDAYMSAMEIVLTRAPTAQPRPFMSWLYTVIRNEAIAVAKARRREGPTAGADLAETLDDQAAETIGPDAVAAWRDRYHGIQDAIASLTEAQRVCLMLRSAGCSYAHIGAVTQYSPRKIERSILEGRAALHAWEMRLASGEHCERMSTVIARVVDREATDKERKALSRHLKHCFSCKAALRSRRQSTQGLAAMVPPALLVIDWTPVVPDPSLALGYWERLVGSVTVRTGSLWQGALELPSLWGSKVGAGTVAVVVAGAAGGPFVIEAVNQPDPPSQRAPLIALVSPAAPTAPPVAVAPPSPVAVTPPPPPVRRARPAVAPRLATPTISTGRLLKIAAAVRRDHAAVRARAASVAAPRAVPGSAVGAPVAPQVVPIAVRASTPSAPPRSRSAGPALEFGP